jgi:hypothetical protein
MVAYSTIWLFYKSPQIPIKSQKKSLKKNLEFPKNSLRTHINLPKEPFQISPQIYENP